MDEIRDLLSRILAWPGTTPEARRLASTMWHDTDGPALDPDGLSSLMARLTGELRACRYTRDPAVRRAVDTLRERVTALEAGQPEPWAASPHRTFAARTRAAARAAGLDL